MRTIHLVGWLSLPWWGYAIVSFVSLQLMFLGISLFLHREQAHDALELHPALRHLVRLWLWLTCGTVTKQWVAVHRKHHVFADRPGDPHSPVVYGLRRVLWGGYGLYRVAARDPALQDQYGRGTPDDWIERRLYSRWPTLGLVSFTAAEIILFGYAGIIMVAVQLAALPFFGAGVINGVGHALGYRSFQTETAATNIVPWGLLLAGEELHNNHHAFPRSARFSVQWWEIDAGWLCARGLSLLGLARIKCVAPRPERVRGRTTVDRMTVRALFANRMHVMRDYARQVVRPVCREVGRAPGAPTAPRLASLLARPPQLLGEDGRRRLNAALDQFEVLRVVLEYRERLQRLWNGGPADAEAEVAELREWCARAERSNIRALRDFSIRLRSYAAAGA